MARKVAKKARRKKTATRKKTTARGRATRKKGAVDLIISKSRTKGAASLNVSGDFYTALDDAVRRLISTAEARAEQNGRRTLRPHDL